MPEILIDPVDKIQNRLDDLGTDFYQLTKEGKLTTENLECLAEKMSKLEKVLEDIDLGKV